MIFFKSGEREEGGRRERRKEGEREGEKEGGRERENRGSDLLALARVHLRNLAWSRIY